jgi:hypothetical protein
MKILTIFLICFILSGCATIPGLTDHKINIGMTKEQVFWKIGSPGEWSKRAIDGHVYETWSGYNLGCDSYDFIDGILIGYSTRGRYYSKDGVEDVRNYKNPTLAK